MRVRLKLLLLLVVLISACGRTSKETQHAIARPRLPDWQEALTGDVHPMADGSAYLVASNGVFYISSGQIAHVIGIPGALAKESATAKVAALADGTAILVYAISDPPAAFWLKQGTAEQVKQTDRLEPVAHNTPTPAGFYFVEASRLRSELENDQGNCEEEDQYDYDDERDPAEDYE